MSTFAAELDKVLTEDQDHQDKHLSRIREISKELQQAKDEVAQKERELANALESLNGQLAVALKKSNPRLSAMLKNGNCVVGYKSKNLQFKPDVNNNTWQVNGSDDTFAKRFHKHFAPSTALVDDVDPLVQSIVKFFTNHYRSL